MGLYLTTLEEDKPEIPLLTILMVQGCGGRRVTVAGPFLVTGQIYKALQTLTVTPQ